MIKFSLPQGTIETVENLGLTYEKMNGKRLSIDLPSGYSLTLPIGIPPYNGKNFRRVLMKGQRKVAVIYCTRNPEDSTFTNNSIELIELPVT